MKRYDKCKSSGLSACGHAQAGVEWIGEIPEHWEIKKLKYLTYNLDSKRIPISSDRRGLKQGIYPYYGATGIIDYIDDYLFDGNCVLVGEDGAPFFIPNRDVAFKASGKFWVNNHAHILKCKDKIIEDILVHQLNLVDYKLYITGSTRDKLTQNDLADIKIIDIPKPEQTAIANYLDEKTAQIDSLIEKKKKLIELYKEERTAIINQAVTRGIDPNVKLKPSGLSACGYAQAGIPKHWEVKKLKYVAKINPTLKKYNFSKDSEEEVVFLPMEKVSENGMITQDIRKKINEVISGFTYFERSDVLVAKITPCFENGKGALLINLETNFGFGSTEFHTLRATEEVLNKFLFYLIKSERFMTIGEAFMTGSAGQKRVPTDFVKEFVSPIPPIEEQHQIVQHIETETKRIDEKIGKTEKEIELLQEYRTALISEVVTGKICVYANQVNQDQSRLKQ